MTNQHSSKPAKPAKPANQAEPPEHSGPDGLADPAARPVASSAHAGALAPQRSGSDAATRQTDASGAAGAAPADEPVPKLPRGRGLKLSRAQLFRIIGLSIILIFLLVTQQRCADAVSVFVTGFDDTSQVAPPGDGTGSGQYERLRPGMTEDETRAVIERARRNAGGGSGSDR